MLGELQVLWRDRPAPLPASKKARALLGYLVVTGRQHTRERLAELLWDCAGRSARAVALVPMEAEAAARTADASAIWSPIASRSRSIRPAPTWICCAAIAARPVAWSRRRPRRWRRPRPVSAASCWRGSICPIATAITSGAWRARVAARLCRWRCSRALVARLSDGPRRRCATPGPGWPSIRLREDGHVEVVRLLGELGRPREALAQYDTCRRILETELGARPSARLEQVRAALSRAPQPSRRRADRRPRPDRDRNRTAIPLRGPRPRTSACWRARLAACAAGEPVAGLLFVGEPGIGKTRLARGARPRRPRERRPGPVRARVRGGAGPSVRRLDRRAQVRAATRVSSNLLRSLLGPLLRSRELTGRGRSAHPRAVARRRSRGARPAPRRAARRRDPGRHPVAGRGLGVAPALRGPIAGVRTSAVRLRGARRRARRQWPLSARRPRAGARTPADASWRWAPSTSQQRPRSCVPSGLIWTRPVCSARARETRCSRWRWREP